MLVLGAGGTLGEAWLRGVLGGLEAGSGLDFRRASTCSGRRAGSIVAATLAAGQRPEAGERRRASGRTRRRCRRRRRRRRARRARSALVGARRGARRPGVATPLAPLALAATAPAGPARPRRGPEPRAAAGAHARRPRRRTSTRSARASTAACGSSPSTARSGRARRSSARRTRPRRRSREAVLASLRRAVDLRAGRDRRARVRRRRRLEPDQPRRRSRRPRLARALPDPRPPGAALAAAADRLAPPRRATRRMALRARGARGAHRSCPDEASLDGDRPEPDGRAPPRRPVAAAGYAQGRHWADARRAGERALSVPGLRGSRLGLSAAIDDLALDVGERADVGQRGGLDDVGRDALAGGGLAGELEDTLASPSASWPPVTASMRNSRRRASRRVAALIARKIASIGPSPVKSPRTLSPSGVRIETSRAAGAGSRPRRRTTRACRRDGVGAELVGDERLQVHRRDLLLLVRDLLEALERLVERLAVDLVAQVHQRRLQRVAAGVLAEHDRVRVVEADRGRRT